MSLVLHTIGSNHERVFISAGKATHTVRLLLETMANVFVCFAMVASKDNSVRDGEEGILIASLYGGLKLPIS